MSNLHGALRTLFERGHSDARLDVLALLAGALLPLAFAPVSLFSLAILSPAVLFLLWSRASPRRAAWLGFLFGAGEFGVGVSWVYVAIHDFGYTGVPLAVLLTLLFVATLALYPALAGYVSAYLSRRFKLQTVGRLLILFPAVWTFTEWFRGWFLTGFPWLSLGYSQIDSPLAGWAPLLGVYGISLVCALSAGALACVVLRGRRAVWVGLFVGLLWLVGGLAEKIEWTRPAGDPIRVSLVQGNLPQITKWDPEAIENRLTHYAELTKEQMGKVDVVVWPENALTLFYHELKDNYLEGLEQAAKAAGTDVLLGLPVLAEDGNRYYTSLMTLGASHGFYHKRHLVPFGEYVPLESLLRGAIAFFDLPMSGFIPGPADQPLLSVAGYKAALSVCYEDAFGESVIRSLPEAALLINGSNNAWYGDSFAPHQHLQISRMRAVETGRPLLRATTNGISAIVDPKGRISARSAQFQTYVLQGEVRPMAGSTPYVRLGNSAVLLLLALMIGIAWGRNLLFRRATQK